jgi:hypothetical protein
MLSHPPYNLNLVSSDRHLFGPFKYHMMSQQYKKDELVQQTMHIWLQNIETDLYHSDIFKLV